MTTRLKGITWEHSRGYDCMVAASRRFGELYPDVDIHWDFRSLQAFADAPIEALAADYDLLVIDHPHIPLAAHARALARLDGVGFDDQLAVLASQSLGRSHESYAYDGHQYGLASDAAAQVAVYRPDLIDEPPKDWDAVIQLARDGRVLWPAKPIDAYSSFVTITANSGFLPGQTEGTFVSESAGLATLSLMHTLAELVPAENLTQNPIDIAEMLSTSDRWVYSPLAFGYTNYSRPGFRPGRLKYIDIPSGPMGVSGSLLGGAGIAVSSHASNLGMARTFAFWVASADIQSGIYYDAGGQPGNLEAWKDKRINSDSFDFFEGTMATLQNAYLRPRIPRYIEFQDLISPLITRCLLDEVSDTDLIARMNDAAAELLRKG